MVGIIVFSSIALLVVFAAAWMLRPDLRAWIERPKYRFQANVQNYDQEQLDHEHLRVKKPGGKGSS
jgi:hypothetical protein